MQQLADQMLLLLHSLLDWLLFYNTNCEKEENWNFRIIFLTASKRVSYNKTRLKSFFSCRPRFETLTRTTSINVTSRTENKRLLAVKKITQKFQFAFFIAVCIVKQ